MRVIRRFPLYLIAGLVILTQVRAQPARPTPEARADSLAKQLSLSDEQKGKVLEIFTAADDSMKAVFDRNSGDRGATRAAMQTIRKDTDKKMKEVLTGEQYTAWQKLRPAMRGRRRMNSGGN